jgi:hypothetical protein
VAESPVDGAGSKEVITAFFQRGLKLKEFKSRSYKVVLQFCSAGFPCMQFMHP